MTRLEDPTAPCSRCGRRRVVNQSRVSTLCLSCRAIQGPKGDATWMAQGKCAGSFDPDFYDDDAIKAGKYMRWCGPCPVRSQCLAWAIANDEVYGVWGGTTPHSRRQLIVQARRRKTQRLTTQQHTNEGEQ